MRANSGMNSLSEKAKVLFTRWFPWLVISYMAWFAVYFAEERLYGDASYFLFRILNGGHFHIVSGRWIIALIQWPAVLGSWLELPLKVIVVIGSLATSATLLAIFLFITRVLRDPAAGSAVVLVHFVGLGHALFCPVFELYYGAMVLVAFVATLRSQRITARWRLVLLSLFFFLVVSCHFMGLIVMLMVLVLERIWTDRRLLLWLMLLLVLHLWTRLYFLSSYEQDAFSMVFLRLQLDGWTWLFLPGRLVAMAIHCATAYPDTLAIALLTAAILTVKKDVFGLTLFLSGLLLIYVALGLYFPDATATVYREIVDYPVQVWVVVLLWRRIMVYEWAVGLVLTILIGAFVFRVFQPLQIAEAYTERVVWMKERIVAAHLQGIRCGMVQSVPVFQPCDAGQALWGLDPLQVMLISAATDTDSVVLLVPLKTVEDVRSVDERWSREMEALGMHRSGSRTGHYFHVPEEPFLLLQ